ncbi:hypothetical protein BpHYR1_001299 [Brachionus plicatilis]|uniref:Uncharacterized protein n=1 Tax=Brachionus plicatilis TaxID=10195 RepID=A0A3M7T786_BRAPC|nr:hypothetical protein BpHYR1_001299 [Brachionus plicatilis]
MTKWFFGLYDTNDKENMKNPTPTPQATIGELFKVLMASIAGGSGLTIVGRTYAQITIGEVSIFTFLVVIKDLVVDCVLGMDLLQQCPFFKKPIEELRKVVVQISKQVTIKPRFYLMNVYNSSRYIRSVTDINIDKYMNKIQESIKSIAASSLRELKSSQCFEHTIQLMNPNIEPIRQKTRRIPYSAREEFKKMLDEMLDAKLIQPSNSPNGKVHTNADALSRWPLGTRSDDEEGNMDSDNNQKVVNCVIKRSETWDTDLSVVVISKDDDSDGAHKHVNVISNRIECEATDPTQRVVVTAEEQERDEDILWAKNLVRIHGDEQPTLKKIELDSHFKRAVYHNYEHLRLFDETLFLYRESENGERRKLTLLPTHMSTSPATTSDKTTTTNHMRYYRPTPSI